MTEPVDPSNPQRRLARAIAAAASVVLVGLGLWSVLTQTYAGHTSKLGGAEVVLSGSSAVWSGMMLVAIGLLPLALWARTGKQAGWWASACMVGCVVCLMGSIYA